MVHQLRLQELPQSILKLIIRHILVLDPQLRTTLVSSLGRELSQATLAVLAQHLILNDDDTLLLEAEEGDYDSHGPRTLLQAVWRNEKLGELVESLTVSAAPRLVGVGRGLCSSSSEGGGRDDTGQEGEHEEAIIPIDFPSLSYLLQRKLPNLTAFNWTSSNIPNSQLCAALGSFTKNLITFKFQLEDPDARHGILNGPTTCSPLSSSHASSPSLRWDASHLSLLPISVAIIQIGHLSYEGSRELSSALQSGSLPNLESLELSCTLFVDDSLFEAMKDGAAMRRLKHFGIREMAGTKLTDKGILDLFHACPGLESFVLDNVEGAYHLFFLPYSFLPWLEIVARSQGFLPLLLGYRSILQDDLGETRSPFPLTDDAPNQLPRTRTSQIMGDRPP